MPTPAFIVRLQAAGPWRLGPIDGAPGRTDRCLHSDTLFNALTHAMASLGWLEEWLESTVQSTDGPAVFLSSFFPYQDVVHYVSPPRIIWPPEASSRIRWHGVDYIPLSLVNSLLAGDPLNEDNWKVDGWSRCLVPLDLNLAYPGPFRIVFRRHAAVDRFSGIAAPRRVACLEFAPECGLWGVVGFSSQPSYEVWGPRVRAAFQFLADTGIGGGRSRGWGRSRSVEFIEGELPGILLYNLAPPEALGVKELSERGLTAYWLLSLYSPADTDEVDWEHGDYRIVSRNGRIESPARWGSVTRSLPMVAEGSVIFARNTPTGKAWDVSPGDLPHPVYRSGFALALPLTASQEEPA